MITSCFKIKSKYCPACQGYPSQVVFFNLTIGTDHCEFFGKGLYNSNSRLKQQLASGLDPAALQNGGQLDPWKLSRFSAVDITKFPGVWILEEQYGRYQIKKQLGSGTMGVVYLAHDPRIDRLVALKVLRPDRVVSEEFVQRFLKEARAIGRLTHPNIVVVYDVGRDHGTIYIAMEYLEGHTFNTVIKSGRPDYATWAKIGIQLANTLAYAHENGIIHRDIKPSNIIFTEDDRIKLTDFGIARIEDLEATLQTQVGDILGTPAYMSPEQVAGRPVDGRSDLFSLGVVLYEWLLGVRPFSGKNMGAIFSAISNQPPPIPREIAPDLPKPLSEFLLKCLQKPLPDRYQSGKQMAAAIKDSLTQLQSLKTVSGGNRHRQPRLKWGLGGVILLVAAGYFGGTLMDRQGQLGVNAPSPTPVDAPVAEPPALSVEVPPAAPPPSSIGHPPEKPPETLPQAALNVTSTPPGAQLFVDDDPKGITPTNLSLPLGTHNVRLRLADYYDWEAAIQLSEPGQMPLHIRLIRNR